MAGPDSPSEDVVVGREGPIVTVTFNRPAARNALTWTMYERLEETCEAVDADDAVRVLVLRGAGGQAFVAGTDIAQFLAFETGEDGLAYERELDRRIERLERVRKPVVAQVEGYAIGGGLRIAAAADIRIATPAARFGAPIARTLGNCLSMAACASLIDLFGASRLLDMMFTARLVDAEEARAAGFVHEIVPADQIAGRVAAVAGAIASHAPITLAVTKEAVRRIRASRVPDGDDLVRQTYASLDFREGVRAFVDKRPPRWTGR